LKRTHPARPVSAGDPAQESTQSLARLVRQSRVLDPVAKRNWLNLLPYLTRHDRERLESLLQADVANDSP
jgi:hypothetical protein